MAPTPSATNTAPTAISHPDRPLLLEALLALLVFWSSGSTVGPVGAPVTPAPTGAEASALALAIGEMVKRTLVRDCPAFAFLAYPLKGWMPSFSTVNDITPGLIGLSWVEGTLKTPVLSVGDL